MAIIDWRAAASLKDNAIFLDRAAREGKVRPRERRAAPGKYRSLTLREDGTCQMQQFSPAAVARRLGGVVARNRTRRARTGERG